MEIILAEPSKIARRMMSDILRQRGDRVFTTGDGGVALSLLLERPTVDAVITSIELPSVSGLELCWEARNLAASRAPLYIIVMSSNHDRKKLIEALDCGADDFIRKPPVPEELVARLRAAERLLKAQKDVLRMAQTDPLTGCFNRRMFFQRLNDTIDGRAQGQGLSMVLVDIDHFKSINDTYGHDVGDLVICHVAGMFRQSEGVFGRIGGEEFGWFLPGHGLSSAADQAEVMRNVVETTGTQTEQGMVAATCSFGVSEYVPGEPVGDLVRRADLALYDAKSGGRNCVQSRMPMDAARASA